MDSASIIDRKRLERYPLATDSLFLIVFSVPMLLALLVMLFAMNWAFAPMMKAPSDALPAGIEVQRFIYGNPWLGLVLGIAYGLFHEFVVLRRFDIRLRTEMTVDAYFLTRDARAKLFRDERQWRNILRTILTAILSMLALGAIAKGLGADLYISMMAFILSSSTLNAWRMAPVFREVRRRWQIALAWEGVDAEKLRLTVRQKLSVPSNVAFTVAFTGLIGFLVYFMLTDQGAAYIRGSGYFLTGTTLSAVDADALEERLATQPEDYDARLQLIGYTSELIVQAKKQENKEEALAQAQAMAVRARYFAEHLPGHGYTTIVYETTPFSIKLANYADHAALWREQIERNPSDPDVIWNAAAFFERRDEEYYRSLLERGHALEPNERRWTTSLSNVTVREAEQSESN